MASATPDLFDGTFDNRASMCREVWQNGRLCRYARRNCVGTDESHWRELHAPWGHFPDYPGNASALPQPIKETQ